MSSTSSANGDGNGGSGEGDRPSREIAYRLFAAEFDDASFSYSESDEERAPNYVVTPSGARINRLFAVGVLTEVERVNDDVLRGRIVDPTGAFVSYAGQYQPDEMAFLDRASPPAFVALSGKARTFQPEDSDRVFTSVRPESVSRVDAGTRDRWTVSAAEATLERVGVTAAALRSELDGGELRRALVSAGVDESLAAGVPLALDHYGTTPAYLAGLRRLALDALEVVADERDSVRPLERAPADAGDGNVDLAALAADIDLEPADVEPADAEPSSEEGGTETPDAVDPERGTASAATPGAESAASEPDTNTTEESSTAGTTTDETTTADEPERAPTADDPSASATGATETGDGSTTAGRATESTDGTAGSSAVEPEPDTDPVTPSGATEEPEGTPPAAAEGDELGDFDSGGSAAGGQPAADTAAESTAEEAGTGDVEVGDEMYELDDEEREEIEAEFGTEFSTGSEVAPAGEADIDVPSVEDLEDELDADLGSGAATESEPAEPADEATATGEPDDEQSMAEGPDDEQSVAEGPDDEQSVAEGPDDEDATAAGEDVEREDVDLEAAAVEAMADLDEGDGASREAVIARLVDEYGVSPGDVEDAIESALMSGQCYEPSEDSLKAI